MSYIPKYLFGGMALGIAVTTLTLIAVFWAPVERDETTGQLTAVDGLQGTLGLQSLLNNKPKVELRGILAYNRKEGKSHEEYDDWLWNVHYPDLLANPHLKKITLSTTSEKKAKLSSGAEVEGDTFYRMAQLHFDDAEAYDQFITYFQKNPIPAERGPQHWSAFKFYVPGDTQEVTRRDVDMQKCYQNIR